MPPPPPLTGAVEPIVIGKAARRMQLFQDGRPDGLKLQGDWTAGCIAVTDTERQGIRAVTPIDTRVELRPQALAIGLFEVGCREGTRLSADSPPARFHRARNRAARDPSPPSPA